MLQEFKKIKPVTKYNTLIITGPKGCGKTSALKLMASQLREMGEKAYYIDLATDHVAVDILQSLRDLPPSTLLIDNVQLIGDFKRFRFDEYVHPNIVAACSPGYNDQKIKSFRKLRGDGKVRDVYFQPLGYEDAKALLTWVFSRIKEGDSGYQKPAVDFNKLATVDYEKLFRETGGVPRYLIEYCTVGNHNLMMSELRRQFHDALGDSSTGGLKLSPDEFCQQLIKIMTNTLSPPNQLVELGIAYVDHQNQVCLASHMYIKWALQYSGYIVETKRDSQVLENLTILNLMSRECVVKNFKDETMKVPIATKVAVQGKVGDLPHQIDVGSVALVKLAPDHPVINLLLIDKRTREVNVYFIQVSSQKYIDHSKKREDLRRTKLTRNNPVKVSTHYQQLLRYKMEYFVYATPDSEHKHRDNEVYFLDLKEQVFYE